LREAILAEELECDPYHPDGRELLVEWDEIHAGVYGIAGDRATEVGRLLRRLIWVAGVLIDLGLPSIEDIPQLPKIA
jgi:hypothetical protein